MSPTLKGHMYVAERQVEFWTNVKIIDDLQSAGFSVTCTPIEQRLEKLLAIDAAFVGDQVKLFGLQYKVLYAGANDYWKIRPPVQQRDRLAALGWGYYCLSDVKASHQSSQALHLARFVDPDDVDSSAKRVTLSGVGTTGSGAWYARWGAFLSMLVSCRRSQLVEDPDAVVDLLVSADQDGMVDDLDVVALLSWDTSEDQPIPVAATLALRSLDPEGDWTVEVDPDRGG